MTLGSLSLPMDRPFTAEEADVSATTLARLVAHGHLRRAVRGVFVSSALADTLALRAAAVGLVVPAHAVVTDRTAAWLHGVDVLLPGEQLVVPDVEVFDRRRGRRTRRGTVRSGQRMMPDSDVMRIADVTVTTPLRTAIDLGRQRQPARAFAEAEAMVRAGVAVEEILRELPRFAGYRWIRQFRELAPLLDPRPESIPESIMRFRWLGTGQPRPEPQRARGRSAGSGVAPRSWDRRALLRRRVRRQGVPRGRAAAARCRAARLGRPEYALDGEGDRQRESLRPRRRLRESAARVDP